MPLAVAPYARVQLPTITPWSWEAVGAFASGYFVTATNNSAAWPLANLSILVPFSTWQARTVVEVAWQNGTGTTGNIDIGIYASDGATLLASLGTTGKGAASATVTTTTFTDYALPAGDYYMACAVDGVTNVFANPMPAPYLAAMGVLEATSNFPLVTGITPVVTTRAYLPTIALCFVEATAL